MTEKFSFLVRKLPANTEQKLPKEIAVVSISINAKSPHYLFQQAHHSLVFHPELNRQMLQVPVKHRHVTVALTPEQALKYQEPFTATFHFEREPLLLWKMTIGSLTGN